MSIYKQFKKSKILVGETESLYIYKLFFEEKEYEIILTKRYATVRTSIECYDDVIAWFQGTMFTFPFGGFRRKSVPIYKYSKNNKAIKIFVINGKPGEINGLDAGIFRCASNFDVECLNVMSYNRFKKL